MLAARAATSSSSFACSKAPARPLIARPPRAVHHQVLSDLAAVGDVDAPIGVVIGGAILVTLIGTAIIPLALSPGQDAANKIFSAKQRAPIDEGKKGGGGGKKGKAPPPKRR